MKPKRSMKGFALAMIGIIVVGSGLIIWSATRPRAGVTDVDMTAANAANAKGYVLGDTTAPVQIIEFADFECPACMQFATLTEPDVRKRLVDTKQAYIRFYDYPLPNHRNTWEASHAAACADEQGKFWEMHDRIFGGQDKWSGEATSRPKGIFEDYAREIGLNVEQWEQCYDSRKYQARIAGNRAEAERLRVTYTPTFIVGGKMYPGAMGFDELRRVVEAAAANGTGRAAPAGAATPAATGAAPATAGR